MTATKALKYLKVKTESVGSASELCFDNARFGAGIAQSA
jgi:hypothetical protein